MLDLKGMRAIVTGASSGIGEQFARQLAARGANLVITARRTDRLEKLAAELREAHKIEVVVLPLDLGRTDAATDLFERTEGAGKPVDILLNNAGFGTQDAFVDIPWERVREQLQLNVVSLTELTQRFLKPMLARGRGWVLNVASIGAYMPVPDYATYAAGKAYVRNFTEALAHELRRTPVRVCCLSPGGTATEFMAVAGQELPAALKVTLMSADRCARIGLGALFGGRRNIIAGWMNSIGMWLLRFTPRRLMVRIAALIMEKPRKPGTLPA
ncbi:MAG: SDR family oxidoreductase [Deltaproteobacteria bacterium]